MAKKTYIFVIMAIFTLYSAFPAGAQEACRMKQNVYESEIYFRFDRATVDTTYRNNAEIFSKIDSIIRTVGMDRIDSIIIKTQSSPEGVYEHNISLTRRRATSIAYYMRNRWDGLGRKLRSFHTGEAWDALRTAVMADTVLTSSQREKALAVLDADINVGTRKWRMEQLPFYDALRRRHYPTLRFSAICIVYYSEAPVQVAVMPKLTPIASKAVSIAEMPEISDEVILADDEPAFIDSGIKDTRISTPYIRPYRIPVVAFKTNLLVPAFNAGIQVPIGQHWSVGADWYWPWIWPSEKNDKCFELLGGYFEGRYWFGRNRQKTQRLLGHSVGVHVGGGYYDLEKNYRGMQGEFAITGLDYKFALPLGRSRWGHLDFLIGFGYIYSSGRTYDVYYEGGPLIADENVVKFNFFGPTRAEISLTIPIYSRKEGRK